MSRITVNIELEIQHCVHYQLPSITVFQFEFPINTLRNYILLRTQLYSAVRERERQSEIDRMEGDRLIFRRLYNHTVLNVSILLSPQSVSDSMINEASRQETAIHSMQPSASAPVHI